jgi:hypothetical protein
MKSNGLRCVVSSVLFSLVPGIIYSQVLNSIPTRVVGHALNPAAPLEGLNPTNFNPNSVEGRELYGPTGVALDKSVSPPILYVSDTLKIACWRGRMAPDL